MKSKILSLSSIIFLTLLLVVSFLLTLTPGTIAQEDSTAPHIAKNFASGLVLLFERSVQVGDFIEVGNYIGTVEKVGARSIIFRFRR